MPNERTSRRIASIAARGMNDPKSLTAAEIKSVCASAVTQFETGEHSELWWADLYKPDMELFNIRWEREKKMPFPGYRTVRVRVSVVPRKPRKKP